MLLRVIRAASDSDSDLTQRAAALALADSQLDPLQREKLTPLAGDLNASQAGPAAAHQASPSEEVASSSLPQEEENDGLTQADGSSLDPNAISMDSLSDDAIGEVASDADEQESWNAPSLVQDLSWELPDDEDEGASESGDQGGTDPEQLAGDSQAPAAADEPPQAGELRVLKLKTGVPLVLDERGLKLETDQGGKLRVTYDRLEALGVAAVPGLDGGEPVHIIDVVLNWTAMSDEPLKVMRMRSDHFDATQLYPDAESRLEALRCLVKELLDRSEANPLPSADAALGQPFASYDSLEDYERSVLMVSGKAPLDS